MLDLGWSEIAVIAVLALVVIGPKDLPKVLRTVGRWVRKIRAMGGEFQKQMDEVMRETGADEVRKQVNTIARTDIGGKIDKAVDPDGSLGKSLREKPIKAKKTPPPEQAALQEQPKREEGTGAGNPVEESGGDVGTTPKAASAEQQQ
ncbi:MAG: Sec-independent protein translocase protein TatB [Rhodospirillum sp.]|nr:Sec-independent protein translocase protein TatB [Rhodospirillum sp.]MCF8490309.1 Sec-independent protein translocase protein TatB [Rhodospirillum sp.]MCF8500149.1 Sec-independent protein translocase protein TatB [Rhodospirillum sp.]